MNSLTIGSEYNFIDGQAIKIDKKFIKNDLAKFTIHLEPLHLETFKLRFSSFTEAIFIKFNEELEIELQNKGFANSEGGLKIFTLYQPGYSYRFMNKPDILLQKKEIGFYWHQEKLMIKTTDRKPTEITPSEIPNELYNNIKNKLLNPKNSFKLNEEDQKKLEQSALVSDYAISKKIKPSKFIQCCLEFTRDFSRKNNLNILFNDDYFESILLKNLRLLHDKRIYIKNNLELFNSIKALFLYFKVTSHQPENLHAALVPCLLRGEVLEQISMALRETLLVAYKVDEILRIENKNYDLKKKHKQAFDIADKILCKIKTSEFNYLILQAGNPIPKGKEYCDHAFYVILKKIEGNKLNIIIINGGSNKKIDNNYESIEYGFGENWLCREITTASLDNGNICTFIKHYIYQVLVLRYNNYSNDDTPNQFIEIAKYKCKLIKTFDDVLTEEEIGFYLNNDSELMFKFHSSSARVNKKNISNELYDKIIKALAPKKNHDKFVFEDDERREIIESKLISSYIAWCVVLDNIYFRDKFTGYIEGDSVYIKPQGSEIFAQDGPNSIASQTLETCTVHNLMQAFKVLFQWSDFQYGYFVNDIVCRYNSFLKKDDDSIVRSISTVSIEEDKSDGAFFFEEFWQDQQGGISLVTNDELILDEEKDSVLFHQNLIILKSDQIIFTKKLLLPGLSTDLVRIANYEHRAETPLEPNAENLVHEEVQSYSYLSFIDDLAYQLDLNWQIQKLLHLTDLWKFEILKAKYGIKASFDAFRGSNSDFRKSVLLKLHPDKNSGNLDCNGDFIFVTNLREKLSKPFDVQKFMNEEIQTIQPFIYKANIGFKVFDTTVDTTRLIHIPTTDNAKKTLMDVAYVYGMYKGINGISFIPIGYEAVIKYQHVGLYQTVNDLLPQLATTVSYMLLPTMISSIGIPYVGFAYSVGLMTYSGYNAIENGYSFYNEFNQKDFKLNSNIAYQNLAEKLATTYLQNLYDFASKAQEYEKAAYKIKLEEKSEFGQRLYEYIYSRIIEEKYELLNKVVQGILTEEETDSIKAKHIKVFNYDHCMEIIELKEVKKTDHYYCYNEEQQVLDHIVIIGGSYVEKISSL